MILLTRGRPDRGFHVIINRPMSAADHARSVAGVRDRAVPVHMITLSPPREAALRNRGERALTPGEQRRIGERYQAGIATPPSALSSITAINPRRRPPR